MQKSIQNDQELHRTMVNALYGTRSAINSGMAIASLVMLMSAYLTGDLVFAALSAGMATIGVFRHFSHVLKERAGDRYSTIFFERLALTGALSTAAVMSLYGAYTITEYTDDRIALLATAQTIGYIAGIAGRNSSRPFITNSQVTIAVIPYAYALMAKGDLTLAIIAASIGMTVILTISSSAVIHRVFISNFAQTRELKRMATVDTITGLLNRHGFMDDLDRRLTRQERVHVLSIDVDNFKGVNDTFGHDVGDQLLSGVAERILSVLNAGDAAARIGGDEFMIVTNRSADDAITLAETIVRDFHSPMALKRITLSVSVSVGLAEATSQSIEDALKRCDLAVYKAKSDGKNRWAAYSLELSRIYDERIMLDRDMRAAVAAGEIDLHYQPVYHPKGRTVTICEALMRWTHPTRGPISPARFIPLAEQNGLIQAIGAIAIEKAIAAAAEWPSWINVSVNVSPKQFHRDHDLVGIVRDALIRTAVDPSRIILEITESTLADDEQHVIATLTTLRSMGVKIALDDFGTGYSSLSYIAKLPIDKIKIDRSFIQNVTTSVRARSLLKAITGIAHDLNLEVIVEGVETAEQLDAVTEFGIHGIQGYYFAKPMPKDAVTQLMNHRCHPEDRNPADRKTVRKKETSNKPLKAA